jgi:hypothetical protein
VTSAWLATLFFRILATLKQFAETMYTAITIERRFAHRQRDVLWVVFEG